MEKEGRGRMGNIKKRGTKEEEVMGKTLKRGRTRKERDEIRRRKELAEE